MTTLALVALALFGTAACAPNSSSNETAGTTTTQGSTTAETTTDDTSESGMTSTETDTGDGPDDTTLSGGSFYGVPEDISESWGCDPWMQDCPEGEKCVPYSSTGTNWDANKCVPIIGDGQPGEPCTYDGVVEATDSCDGSGVCWNAMLVDGELLGTCTPFCMGTAVQPECAEGSTCVIANRGSITLCIETCDPLGQDCPDGLACQWIDDQFACLPGAEEPFGQPCGINGVGECPAGGVCVLAELIPGCADTACCTAFCSLSQPMCSEPTSACVPFFDEPPPAGYEDLGVCVAP